MGAPSLVCNFASTTTINLEAFTPQVGSAWVNTGGSSQAIINATTAMRTSGSGGAVYTNASSTATGNITVSYTYQCLSLPSTVDYPALNLVQGSYQYVLQNVLQTGGGWNWNLYKQGSGGNGYLVNGVSGSTANISLPSPQYVTNSFGTAINQGVPSYSIVWNVVQSGSSTIHTVTANGSVVLTCTDNGSQYGSAIQGPYTMQWQHAYQETDTTGVRFNNLIVMDTGTVAAPDTNVVLSPASSYVVAGTSFSMENNTQTAKFSFSGTSLFAQLNLNNWIQNTKAFNSYPSFIYSVDDGPWQYGQITNAIFMFAQGLSNTTHQIEIILVRGGLTQYQNNYFNVTGWYLDSGKTISAPTSSSAALPNRLAIFGDSITDGYASGAAFGDLTYSSPLGVLECYATICAKVIEAELGSVGYSGQGLIYTGNFSETVGTTSANYYSGQARVWPTGGNALTHIILAQGTNDIGLVESASITAQTMETAIITQMAYFRTHNATAMIVVLVPSTVNYSGTSAIWAAAFSQYQSTYPNDTNILLADPTTQVWSQGFGGSSSPNPYSKYGYASVHGTMQWHILLGSWLGSLINSTTAALNGANAPLNLTETIVYQSGGMEVSTTANVTAESIKT